MWDGLVAIYDAGLADAVGVSNYGERQLRKIQRFLSSRGVPLASAQARRCPCLGTGRMRLFRRSRSPRVLPAPPAPLRGRGRRLCRQRRRAPSTRLPARLPAHVQVQYSLLSRGAQQEAVREACAELGVRMIAYSPLTLGLLTGKYDTHARGATLPGGPRGLLFRQLLPGLDPLLAELRRIAASRRKSVSQARAGPAAAGLLPSAPEQPWPPCLRRPTVAAPTRRR